jgi:hypothetical protein
LKSLDPTRISSILGHARQIDQPTIVGDIMRLAAVVFLRVAKANAIAIAS